MKFQFCFSRQLAKKISCCLFVLKVLLPSAFAANLVQVYQQAVMSDPTFAQAESTWNSERENFPIAVANLLPNITLSGGYSRDFSQQIPTIFANTVDTNGFYSSYNIQVSISQPIFDYAAWTAVRGAKAEVKAATANYLAAAQDLMVRTVQAYFNVLKAYERLRFTIANKVAVYRQLVTVQQQFKVGLVAVTGVYDARSAYDQAIATEIADQNNLNNQIENLRAITGVHYFALSGLVKQVPLKNPLPNNIQSWVNVAKQQNYGIRAQEFNVQAALQAVKQQEAGHFPVVTLDGKYNETRNYGYRKSATLGLNSGQIGVNLSVPIYQGGGIQAHVRQARYNYLTASGQLEFQERSTVNNTRQAFLGVISGLSQIQADRQAIISARNALAATKAGYVVGTRTMTDVLNDLSTLYQTQQTYADDQYGYLFSIVQLKESAGILNEKDLSAINDLLTRQIVFPLDEKVYGKQPAKLKKQAGLSHPTHAMHGLGNIDTLNDLTTLDAALKDIDTKKLQDTQNENLLEPAKVTPTPAPMQQLLNLPR